MSLQDTGDTGSSIWDYAAAIFGAIGDVENGSEPGLITQEQAAATQPPAWYSSVPTWAWIVGGAGVLLAVVYIAKK